MANDGRVLVLGAGGNIGRKLISELARAGQLVTAASRSPERLAAQANRLGTAVRLVRLDYADPTTFGEATQAADRMFVLAPGDCVDSDGLLAHFLDRTLPQMRRVVTLTAQGVEASDQIPHRRLELRVERASASWTHLRPTWFADNFHTYWRRQVHEGTLALPAGAAKTAFVDARDIAACASVLLAHSFHEREALVVTGPEALDYHQAAAVLSSVLQRPIRYTTTDDGSFLRAAIHDGVPPPYAGMIATLFGMVRAGITEVVTDTVRKLTRVPARGLADYASAHARELQGAADPLGA